MPVCTVFAQARAPLDLLILGGTGSIGPHLVRRAVARGHREDYAFLEAHEITEAVPWVLLKGNDRGSRSRSIRKRRRSQSGERGGYPDDHTVRRARQCSFIAHPYMKRVIALSVLLAVFSLGAAAQPGARACHVLTFIPGSGSLVVGGARECGVGVVTDTSMWKWDGRSWAAAAPFAGGAREDVHVAYDSRRNRLVAYGGRNAGRVYTDTWEWDGRVWAQQASARNPGPLEHAAAAFDSARGRVVMFGGGSRTGTLFANTWEWDGRDWMLQATSGPAARVGHSMVWSPAHGAVIMYGGFAAQPHTDLWKWDGSAWLRLTNDGPATTEGPALAVLDGSTFLVAAPHGATELRTWRVSGSRFEILAGAGAPPSAIGQGMTTDAARHRVVWFGGGQVWEFDGARWASVHVSQRPRRP
jgi:hypothetical protein